jgi:hypothetical protein
MSFTDTLTCKGNPRRELSNAATAWSYARSAWRIGFPSNFEPFAVDATQISHGKPSVGNVFAAPHAMRIDLTGQCALGNGKDGLMTICRPHCPRKNR